MAGAPSKQRRKAIEKYVDSWVSYAFYSKDFTNPFSGDDKRHGMFIKQLGHTVSVDADFRDIHEVYGGDVTELTLRPYPKPVLVPIESLGPPRLSPPQNKV